MPNEAYKNLILLAVFVTIAGLSVVLKLWPYGINRTFSQHVARHKAAIIYYILLFALILPTLSLFIFKWFIPTFNPPNMFGVLVALSAISAFGCTLVPEVGGRKTIVHQMLAFFSADCLLPAIILLVFTPALSGVARVTALVASIAMITTIGITLKAYYVDKFEHKYMLILQATYYALFFIPLLVATYL